MTATITHVSNGEYSIDRDWQEIAALQRSIRANELSALWGVGSEHGRAAIFGKPTRFDGRRVVGFGMSPVAHLPFEYRYEQAHFGDAPRDLLGSAPLRDVDPRTVEASQWGLRADAMRHYFTVPYEATGELFDTSRNTSNDWPLIFIDEQSGTKVILQGHHRTTAALLSGRFVRARLIRGHIKRGVRR